MKEELIITCPHCNLSIIIEKMNCCIFRHGILKATGKQINPHADKNTCDELFSQQLIFGCGKPFQIVKNNEKEYIAVICHYI